MNETSEEGRGYPQTSFEHSPQPFGFQVGLVLVCVMALSQVQMRKPDDVHEEDPMPLPQDDVETIEGLKCSPRPSFYDSDFPETEHSTPPNRLCHDMSGEEMRRFLRAVHRRPYMLDDEIRARRREKLDLLSYASRLSRCCP